MGEVRIAELADAEAVADIYAPIVRDTVISFEAVAPTADEMAARIEKTLPQFPWLVMADGDEVQGYAYASPHSERAAYRWSANVTIYLGESARGQGVGTALYRSLLSILRRQGMQNAFAGIALPNAASVGLHESVGFTPLGVYRNVGYKFGAWRDVGYWQLPLADGREPDEPIPFSRLRAAADFTP